ncbi:MAG TPA: hypothetical protein DIC56_09905 [Rhizobium sp.]|nr:hypothetical protein [Rhizobium sp.]
MAKHYLGGHTVVGRNSGWFTGVAAPLVGDDRPPPRVPKRPAVPKLDATAAATRIEAAEKLDQLRLAFLHGIIIAAFNETAMPNPPKKAKDAFAQQLKSAGGHLEWARRQPEFAKLVAKRRKKCGGALPPVTGKTGPRGRGAQVSAALTAKTVSKEARELIDLRSSVNNKRIAAFSLIRDCDSQLKEIDAKLSRLGFVL